MGLFSNGGFDGRRERTKQEQAEPLACCPGCNKVSVCERAAALQDSDKPALRLAGSLAASLIEMEPTATPIIAVREGEVATEGVCCRLATIFTAETIMDRVEGAVAKVEAGSPRQRESVNY